MSKTNSTQKPVPSVQKPVPSNWVQLSEHLSLLFLPRNFIRLTHSAPDSRQEIVMTDTELDNFIKELLKRKTPVPGVEQ